MSMLSADERTELNKLVTSWAVNVKNRMKTKTKGRIASGLGLSNRYSFGVIESVGFRFPRFGIFWGMGNFGGLTIEEAKAQGKLKPNPWFNPTLREDLPKLDKVLLEKFEQFSINSTRVFIKNDLEL